MALDENIQSLIDFRILKALEVCWEYDKDLLFLLKKGTTLYEVRKRVDCFREYLDNFTPDELMQIDMVMKTETTLQNFFYGSFN